MIVEILDLTTLDNRLYIFPSLKHRKVVLGQRFHVKSVHLEIAKIERQKGFEVWTCKPVRGKQ